MQLAVERSSRRRVLDRREPGRIKPVRHRRDRFSLSESARVTITISQAKPGRRVFGKCLPPNSADSSHSHCVRYVKVGSIGANGQAGADRVFFGGSIGGAALSPGRYRASAIARDTTGETSTASSVNFSVAK